MPVVSKILLIDDDPDDQLIFREALEMVDEGIELEIASTAMAGLQLINSSPRIARLIFMDINMPGMTGLVCLREIKKSPLTRHIPVIMYSTASLDRYKQQSMQLGAIGYIIKPDSISEVCNKLRAVLAASW